MKIFEDLSNIKNMVINVEKMLNNGMELKLWQWGGRSDPSRMGGRYCGFRLLKASFRQQTYQCRYLPRAFETACGRLGPEGTSWWKIFGGFSIDPQSQDHPAVVCRILDSSGLTTIFCGLEPPGLRYLVPFAGEIPNLNDASRLSGLPTSVHRRGIGPVSCGIHLQDIPLILLPPASCPEKNEVKLE
jgi:hypothetical protein